MAIKAVFFDMGETLCRQVPSTSELVGEFFANRGVAVDARALRYGYFAAMTYYSDWALRVNVPERTKDQRDLMGEEFFRTLLVSAGLGRHAGLIADVREAVSNYGERPFGTLFPDVLPALRALRERNLRLGVISNWDERLGKVVDKLGLMSLMEVVVGSATVGVEKPNAAIFQCALSRMGLLPHEACHVGDIYWMDVLGARAAGIKPVLVDRHSLQVGVDCVRIEHLSDLLKIIVEG